MATGYINNPGGLAAPTDVVGAGQQAYRRLNRRGDLRAQLVSSRRPNNLQYDVDSGRSRIVTADSGMSADAGQAHAHLLDDWRDAFNPQSPAFWLLLMILGILGFMQFRVQVGGKRGVRAGLG